MPTARTTSGSWRSRTSTILPTSSASTRTSSPPRDDGIEHPGNGRRGGAVPPLLRRRLRAPRVLEVRPGEPAGRGFSGSRLRCAASVRVRGGPLPRTDGASRTLPFEGLYRGERLYAAVLFLSGWDAVLALQPDLRSGLLGHRRRGCYSAGALARVLALALRRRSRGPLRREASAGGRPDDRGDRLRPVRRAWGRELVLLDQLLSGGGSPGGRARGPGPGGDHGGPQLGGREAFGARLRDQQRLLTDGRAARRRGPGRDHVHQLQWQLGRPPRCPGPTARGEAAPGGREDQTRRRGGPRGPRSGAGRGAGHR